MSLTDPEMQVGRLRVTDPIRDRAVLSSDYKISQLPSLLEQKSPSRTIMICDRNPVLADGIRRMLLDDSYLSNFGCVLSTNFDLLAIMASPPTILLLDPWKTENPQASLPDVYLQLSTVTSLIGYCPEISGASATMLTLLGFRAIVPRTVQSIELMRIISAVSFGGLYYHEKYMISHNAPPPVVRNATALPALTARERDVLRHVALGSSMKEIASLLQISTKTVDTYKKRANEKLNLRSRSDIVQYAIQSGWMD